MLWKWCKAEVNWVLCYQNRLVASCIVIKHFITIIQHLVDEIWSSALLTEIKNFLDQIPKLFRTTGYRFQLGIYSRLRINFLNVIIKAYLITASDISGWFTVLNISFIAKVLTWSSLCPSDRAKSMTASESLGSTKGSPKVFSASIYVLKK